MRKAVVTLPDDVWNVIDELKGTNLGKEDSEVIQNILTLHFRSRGTLPHYNWVVNRST